MQKDLLERHPELKLRKTQNFQETSGYNQEELVLINIPDKNVILTFLTITAEDIEPFEPKSLWQAKNNTRRLEWEKGIIEEI